MSRVDLDLLIHSTYRVFSRDKSVLIKNIITTFVFSANMEEMRERKDTFEMPEIPNVAIPELREGADNGISNGVSGVTMREGGGRVKRGSIKRQSEILRQKNLLSKMYI